MLDAVLATVVVASEEFSGAEAAGAGAATAGAVEVGVVGRAGFAGGSDLLHAASATVRVSANSGRIMTDMDTPLKFEQACQSMSRHRRSSNAHRYANCTPLPKHHSCSLQVRLEQPKDSFVFVEPGVGVSEGMAFERIRRDLDIVFVQLDQTLIQAYRILEEYIVVDHAVND